MVDLVCENNFLTDGKYALTDVVGENVVHHKTALFNHLTQSQTTNISNNNDNELNNINDTISNIIQQRKEKPKPFPTTNIKLDELPKALIGHTASFLHQNEYHRLEKTNRSIYIGCNTPNMLNNLDLRKIKNYSSINLTKYSSITILQINMTKFHEFKYYHQIHN